MMTVCKRASRFSLPIFGALFVCCAITSLVQAGVSPVWLSIGVLGGVTEPDRDLAKYQWDAGAQSHWGAQIYVGAGQIALGLRGSQTGNEQSLSVPGTEAIAADVRLRSGELLARWSAVRMVGFELYGFGGGGRLQIDYEPGRLAVPIPGTGEVVSVDLESIDGWIGTAGLGLRRGLLGGWGVGVELDHHRFSLETAHRVGTTILRADESFGQWTARAELSWSFGRF